jgi:gas vesicle protein
VKSAFKTLKTKVTGFTTDIKEDANTDFDNLTISSTATTIKTNVLTTFETIKTELGNKVGTIKEDLNSLFDDIGIVEDGKKKKKNNQSTASDIKNSVVNEFKNLKSKVTKATKSTQTDVEGHFNDLADFFDNKLDLTGLSGAFDTELGDINDVVADITNDLETLLNLIPDVTTALPLVPEGQQIPLNEPIEQEQREERRGFDPVGSSVATGGVVGETGMAVIHQGERIVPDAQVDQRGRLDASDIRGMGSAAGVEIQSLTVNADSRSGGRAAGRALKRELKRFDI